MSDVSYSITIYDPFGAEVADASNFTRLQYSRVVNDLSTMVLELPLSFDHTLLRIPDGRIGIERRVPGGRPYLETETTWLMKVPRWSRDDRGKESIIVEADTPLCLLREPGRIIDYAAGSAQADQTNQLDDMMKDIIRQNLGSSATDSARNLSAYLSIAADLSKAPSTNKACAWRSILRTLQEIAAASAQAGTYLAFDIVAPTPNTLEFRTYTGQRGKDRRYPRVNPSVTLGPDFGNIGEADYEENYRDEVTWARAGGQGTGSNRVTATAQDTTRIGKSPFGRREKFVEATKYKDDSSGGITAEANAAVRAGRPRRTYRGRLKDEGDTRYGIHWFWGDYLTVQDFGQLFDARVDAITVTVQPESDQYETIDAWLRSDDIG